MLNDNVSRDRSYINFPDWIKREKKAAIHPKNTDDKCF